MKILNDFSTSVRKALEEIDPNYESYPGLVICGTHSPHDIDSLLTEIQTAREQHLPFLGICFGHQLAAIEYARNVLGIEDATSEEFGQGDFIVKENPEGLVVGLHDGESYWHRYHVDAQFQEGWVKPSFFWTVQYHPEYNSAVGKPHPVLKEFLNYCKLNG